MPTKSPSINSQFIMPNGDNNFADDHMFGDASSPFMGAVTSGLQFTPPEPAPFGMFAAPTSATATTASPVTTTASTSAVKVATTSTSSTTTVPAWVSTLQTASIATDMRAADVNGVVTYSGLKTLLTDLDSTLTSSKTTLTAAELSDLKTIAANLNNGMTTSAYLTSVMTAIATGNSENKTWTGGTSSSVTLGNLATGSSATQLSELIGKWMLGTDLPNSQVIMSGSSTFSVSYTTSSKPLFASSGPSMSDINQGYLGDCYLLSCLAEVAYKNSGAITSMFTSNGNDTYGVRFYVNGVADYVTVNNALVGSTFNSGADIWASLAEKAYAQLQTGGVVTGNSVNYGNSWSTIGNGGAPEYALEEVTGASVITDFQANGNSWYKINYNSSLAMTNYTSGNSTASVLSVLAADLANGDDVILSSYTDAKDSSGKQTLVSDHAMSVYGYDSATGMLQIRNPWGTMSGQYWDTTFEVSLSTLLSAGDVITVDNIGTGTTPAPVVAATVSVTAQTASQTWKLGQAVNFALASNTFTDSKSEKLTYTATLASGAALPSWLTFNATTQTFTGTVPNTASAFSIKVTATDTDGSSASETFSALTPASAPVVSAQTATLSWKKGSAINVTLASNTFTDPQKQTLTYTATLANGSALPTWLKFNGTTDTFTGTVPTTATALSIKVTATDTSGLSASETFTANITTSASAFTQAIASLTLSASSASAALTQLVSASVPSLASPVH